MIRLSLYFGSHPGSTWKEEGRSPQCTSAQGLAGRGSHFLLPAVLLVLCFLLKPWASSPFSPTCSHSLAFAHCARILAVASPSPPTALCFSGSPALGWRGGRMPCSLLLSGLEAWMKSNQGTISQAPGSGSSHLPPHSLS